MKKVKSLKLDVSKVKTLTPEELAKQMPVAMSPHDNWGQFTKTC